MKKTGSLVDALGAAIAEMREELTTRAAWGRNPAPGQGQSPTAIDARQEHYSIAVALGWDFAKEPSRERDGPDLER